MHAWIKRRGPTCGEGWAPAIAGSKELDCTVCVAVFIEAGECHHSAVAQHGYSRVPASVSHPLHIRKAVRRRIIKRGIESTMEWIVLCGATVDHRTTIRQHDHAVAKHVPCDRLSVNCSCLRIPQCSLLVCVSCNVSGAGDNHNLATIEQCDVNRIDGHGVGQRAPLPRNIRLCPCGCREKAERQNNNENGADKCSR